MTDATHNIRPEFFVEDTPANGIGSTQFRDYQYQTLSTNLSLSTTTMGGISVNQLLSQVVWDFATGENQWLDLSKTRIYLDYNETIYDNDLGLYLENPLSNLFSRASWTVNGATPSQSNNFTQDYEIAVRFRNSQGYNEVMNDMCFAPIADSTSGALAATRMSDSIGMDACCGVMHDFLLIPPRTRLTFTYYNDGDAFNWVRKCLCGKISGDASAEPSNFRISINNIVMRAAFYTGPPPPETYRLRIMAIDSSSHAVTGTTEDIVKSSTGSTIMLAIAIQDTRVSTMAAADTANDYAISARRFLYTPTLATSLTPLEDAEGTAGVEAKSPLTIQWFYNSNAYPPSPIDNSASLKDGWYMTMQSINKVFNTSGGEVYGGKTLVKSSGAYAATEPGWMHRGPFWAYPIVTSDNVSSQIRARLTFLTSAPDSAQIFFFEFNENLLAVQYNNQGAPVSGGTQLIR